MEVLSLTRTKEEKSKLNIGEYLKEKYNEMYFVKKQKEKEEALKEKLKIIVTVNW